MLFGDNTYNNPVSECLFEVGVEGAEMPTVPTEYYIKKGATGDGLSAESPMGSVINIVNKINADGHEEGDLVTVYVIDSGEGKKEVIDSDCVLGYNNNSANQVPEHKATIKWTSYDPDEVISIIGHVNYQGGDSNAAHWTVSGPSIFEDINIVDMRNSMNGGTDIYLNHWPVEFYNVKFGDLRGVNETQYTTGTVFYPSSTHFAMGMIRGRKTVERDQYVYIDNADIIGDYLNVMGYNDNSGTNITADQGTSGSVTLEIGAGTLKNLNITGSNGAKNELIGGDLSIILGAGVTVSKINTGSIPVVGGVFNLIQNYGATIPAGYTDTPWASTAKTEKAPYYNVVAGAEGLVINTTETAGTFEIDTDALAYAVAADGKTVYYGEDEISLVPGTWTILSAESVDAIVETLEDPTVTVNKVFKGWDTTVDGVITAIIEDAEVEVDPIYYVQANATGNGLSADSPVATIKDAIDLINAAGYDADDTVTIYVLNGEKPEGAEREFYFYDKEGNDIYNKSMKPVDGKYYYGRITAFMPDQGGTLPTHNCTINVKAYDTSVTTYLAYGEVLGNNGNVCLTGDFIFDDITIVACRMYDREFFTGGRNVTFNNCGFAYENCGIHEGAGFTALVTGNERVMLDSVGAGTRPGGNVVINSVMTNQTDSRYGLDISGTKGSTFQNEVNVTINHEDFKGQIVWGDAASTFSNGLNIAIENGNVKNVNKGKTITINGGFQVLVNDGGSMTEMATNIAADKTWIVTAVGADLALTETDGTFAVPEGKVAYVTDAEYAKEILYSVDGLLTLPEGTYTVKFADTLVDIKAAVTPFEDASMKFKGWIDDGAGKLTADYTLTGEAVVYYVQHGATGDGLSLETPGSFATVVAAINEKYGAGDEVTIKVVKAANEADSYTDLSAIALACIKDIPNHTAMLVIESADAENLSWLTTHQSYATSGYISTNVEITSPLTFKNIKVVDPRMDWYGDFYVNATNFTIGEGVTWYQPTYANNTLTLNGRARMSGIHGGSRSTKTFNTAFTVKFADGANLDQTTNGITLSGYSESGTMTFNEEVNFKFGNSTVPKIIVDNMNGGGALFKKNVNIVLNGTTVGNLLSDGGKTKGTVINGALQIIKNNANVKAQTIADSLKANLYDLTVIGAAELDVTEIAGKYTVPAGVVAIAVDAEGNRYVSSNNMLTVPGAGVYTVYTDYVVENNVIDFYNTVTLDVAALEVTEAADEIFLGWVLADGTAPKAEETEFKAGDKLSAKFMEFDVENAEGTAGDFFIKGAQIRLEAPAGLRYVVEMDNEFYAELTQYSAELVEAEKPHFGTYIIPADLYDSTEHAEVPAYKLYDETETDTLYTVCLINIKEGSYDRDYTVYGYIDYIDANGVMHTLTTKDYSTSIYDVAKVAVSKGETSEFLTTIIAAVEAE